MSAKHTVAGLAGAHLVSAMLGTMRIRIEGERTDTPLVAAGQPVIYTLWHARLLPLTYMYRHQDITALISRSGDGEYIAQVVQRWGFDTARGSSSRGGSTGLRELVRAARSGHSLAITPDGPRGPKRKLKPGVLTIAQLSGSPLIPITGSATRAWWLEGWDRFLVPKPFSTLHVRYGAPVFVPRSLTEAELQHLEAQVEQTLNELTNLVDADAGQH